MDLFFSLRNCHKTRKKCRLLMSDSNVLMMMEEKKKFILLLFCLQYKEKVPESGY